MTSPVPNESWWGRALCKGMNPDTFVPARDERRFTDLAKVICSACPVREECLEFALDDPRLDGVWGGTTERERRKLRRQRRLERARKGVD